MRIGSDDSFLSVEKVEADGSTVIWRILASVAGPGCIAAVHSQARVETTDEIVRRAVDFAAHRLHRFDLTLSEGGWLRLKRVPSGRTLVRYRVGQVKAGAALEGELHLEGEPAEACSRELRELL